MFYTVVLVVFAMTYVGAEQNSMSEKVDEVCALCASYQLENLQKQFKEVISDEVNNGLTECQAELEQTEKKLVNLLGKCSVKYGGKCFWPIYTGAGTMNQQQASDLCKNEGGNLSGVYSNDHLNQLIMLGRPHAAEHGIGLWTGMTYENKSLKQRDGSLSPPLKWSPGFPLQGGYSYKVLIFVDKERKNDGIWTKEGTISYYGAICEIEI